MAALRGNRLDTDPAHATAVSGRQGYGVKGTVTLVTLVHTGRVLRGECGVKL